MRVAHSAIDTTLLLIIILDGQKFVGREDAWIMLFPVGLWPLDFSKGNWMSLLFIITTGFFNRTIHFSCKHSSVWNSICLIVYSATRWKIISLF